MNRRLKKIKKDLDVGFEASKDHKTSLPSKPFPDLFIYDYADKISEIEEQLIDMQEGYEKEKILRRKRYYEFFILNSILLYKIKELKWLIATKGEELTEEEKKYYNTTLKNHKTKLTKLHTDWFI